MIRRPFVNLMHAAGYCTRMVDRVRARTVWPVAVMAWGLMTGLIVAGTFNLAWKIFGDVYFSESTRLRLVPAAMVVLVMCVLNMNQLVGLAATVDRCVLRRRSNDAAMAMHPAEGRSLVAVIVVMWVVLVKFAALLAMPYHPFWQPDDWRRVVNVLSPYVTFYPYEHTRVFVLMGLWSKAALILAAGTGTQVDGLAVNDERFRRAIGIRTLAGVLLVMAAVTTVYFSVADNRTLGLLVSLFVFLVVYLASMILARVGRGHDRASMFACAELGELMLLLGYLAIARYM